MEKTSELGRIREMLRESLLSDVEWRCTASDPPGAQEFEFDDSGWGGQKELMGRQWKVAWFRTSFPVPPLLDGCSFTVRPSMGGRNQVYVDGTPAGEQEHNSSVKTPPAVAGSTMVIAIRNEDGWISYENPHPAGVSCDRMKTIRAAYEELFFVMELGDKAAPLVEDCLSRFMESVDYETLSSGKIDEALASLAGAARALEEVGPILKEFQIYVVPHSHVDLAWGWTYEETKRIMRTIFEKATEIMEHDPEYTFAQDQPPTFAHLEGSGLMEKISRYISQGRLDVCGAMYSEPEGNMPCGESFIRQIMVTKRYFLRRFGADPLGCWNLDSFSGHCWSLPQILTKSGVRYYTFANWGNLIPDVEFWWEGPDGSRVLAYHLPCHYDSAQMMDHDKIMNNLFVYAARSKFKRFMFLDGDDLTPPFEGSIDGVKWFNSLAAAPSVKFSTSKGFFADLEREGLESLPVFRGELTQYLEPRSNNVGSYSTHCEVKTRNRYCENLLLTAEKFGSIATLLGFQYPREKMAEAWGKVLLNQMHDILPGTAIQEAYEEAHRAYDMGEGTAREVLVKSLARIASRVNTIGEGIPIVVFNPMPWERTGEATVQVTLAHSYSPSPRIRNAEGEEVGCQLLRDSIGTYDKTNRTIECIFLAEKVPPTGYKVFWLTMGDRPAHPEEPPQGEDGSEGIRLRNEYLDALIDPRTGLLLSLKADGHEYVSRPEEGLLLQRYIDAGDPWHIRLSSEPLDLRGAKSVKVTERGPVRKSVEIRRDDGDTELIQRISLIKGIPRLLCDITIDCKDLNVLYKIGFPGGDGREATFEIPFATISREAKMDRPAQNWADLSGGGSGVALLNNGRYGYDVRDNSIRLTLLRNPRGHKIAEGTDTGRHSTSIGVYPHPGDFRSGVVRQGLEFNNPLISFVDTSHEGDLPPSMPFLSVSDPSAIISSLKPHEDSDDLVLRVYEAQGRVVRSAQVETPITWDAMEEIDMVERSPLKRAGKLKGVFLGPYEIRTFRLRRPLLKVLRA